MVIIQLVHQMLMLADYVGRDQLRSETSWQVGLHVTGLLGAKAPTPTARTHRYPRETFAHVLTATATELGEDSTALTKGAVEVPDVEGVSRLNRWVGLVESFASSPPSPWIATHKLSGHS